jgi:hypothetical protein
VQAAPAHSRDTPGVVLWLVLRILVAWPKGASPIPQRTGGRSSPNAPPTAPEPADSGASDFALDPNNLSHLHEPIPAIPDTGTHPVSGPATLIPHGGRPITVQRCGMDAGEREEPLAPAS